MRALFCSLAARGFLYPQLGIARSFQNAGAEVAVVTNTTFSTDLDRLGLVRIARSEPDGESFHVELWGHPVAIAIQYQHVLRALREFRPDVIVASELALGPVLAARLHGIPLAVLGLATLPWPVRGDEEGTSPRARRARWRRGELARMLDGVAEIMRIGSGASASPLEAADLYLLQGTASMVRAAGLELPENVTIVGSCVWEPDWSDDELADWLGRRRSAGGPLIYAHQGSTFKRPPFWANLIEAAGTGRFSVCASYGRTKNVEDVRTPQVFARAHVPQLRVMPHATAVVCSATTTAVLGALFQGAPLVTIAAGGEQEDLDEICAHLGLATPIRPEEAEPRRLAEAIDAACHRPVPDGLRAELQAAGGRETAVRAIAALARAVADGVAVAG